MFSFSDVSGSKFYRDCLEIRNEVGTNSGVYTIDTGSEDQSISVYCDMEFDEGGWLVRYNYFQTRDFILITPILFQATTRCLQYSN